MLFTPDSYTPTSYIALNWFSKHGWQLFGPPGYEGGLAGPAGILLESVYKMFLCRDTMLYACKYSMFQIQFFFFQANQKLMCQYMYCGLPKSVKLWNIFP